MFLLLKQEGNNFTHFLTPIGLFGVAATLGLFMYELRGIQRCHTLEVQAGTLERQLGLADLGPFEGQPKRALWNMLGPPGAGLIIYLAVVFGWLYVAGVGDDWWDTVPAWVLLPGYLTVEVMAWWGTPVAE